MPKTPSPVWADIMCRDMEKIQWILRETNPDSYPAINRSAEKIAEIVDVEIGEGLEGHEELDDPFDVEVKDVGVVIQEVLKHFADSQLNIASQSARDIITKEILFSLEQ